MESCIKIEMINKHLLDKKNCESLLLECLNRIPFFIGKSGGGFSAPKSESNGQCDAIGKNGCYNIDFKRLLSQEGAQNFNETRLTEVTICEGVTISAPSKASMRGEPYLPFPNIWGFFASRSLHLNENNEIVLQNRTDKHMTETIKSLNRMIHTKKHLLFFYPNRLIIENSHGNPIEVLCNRTKDVLSIISEARASFSVEYETYYALLLNNEMVVFSEHFIHIEDINLSSLDTWQKLRINL